MRKLYILSVTFVMSLFCMTSFAAMANANNPPGTMPDMNAPSAFNANPDMKKMSDMMHKMLAMKVEMMGHQMMMMGMKMKMMGEMMMKSDNKGMQDQGNQLMQLGVEVFNLGSKMNPKPMPMDDKKMCPMCSKMMGE